MVKTSDPLIEEIKQIQKETAASMKETDRRMRETDLIVKETSRKVNELSRNIGSIENNSGKIVEEYFTNSLKEKKIVDGVKYDVIYTNLNAINGELQDEFDICLINGNSVLIIEVKKIARKKHVAKIKKKIENFPVLFKMYKDFKIKGALASFQMSDDVKKEVTSNNLIAMQRKGDVIVCST